MIFMASFGAGNSTWSRVIVLSSGAIHGVRVVKEESFIDGRTPLNKFPSRMALLRLLPAHRGGVSISDHSAGRSLRQRCTST